MSIMSLLSIEKAREECFVLVGVNRFGVIVRVFQHITVCALNRWEDYGIGNLLKILAISVSSYP